MTKIKVTVEDKFTGRTSETTYRDIYHFSGSNSGQHYMQKIARGETTQMGNVSQSNNNLERITVVTEE